MKLTFLIYPLLFLILFSTAGQAYAQKEVGTEYETTKDGIKAKTDSLYFEALKAEIKQDESLALRLFEQFATLRPEVSDPWYEMAVLNYNNRKTDLAIEYIKKAIALNKDNKWYKEKFALILAETGDYLQAATIADELSKAEPHDPGYLTQAAEYYEKAKKYKESLQFLNKAIIAVGPSEELIELKEHVYLSMDSLERAADMVRELIAREPKNGKYYKDLGDLYDNNKEPGKAAQVYERAEKIIPGDPYVQGGRAEHFLRIGDTANYILYDIKAILNTEQDAEEQLDAFLSFIQSLPNDSVVRATGLPVCRQLALQHPADAQVMGLFGDFLDNCGKRDSAVWAYNRSLQAKSSVEVWRKLLENFWERQLADSLIKNSERYIRLYPNSVDPQFFNAEGHYLKKEYDKAIKSINRAIDNQPENDKPALASMYSFMAEIYHSNKQDDFSDKAFDKSISLDPDNAVSLNNYAYFLSERGVRLDEAEKMSKKSLDMKPGEANYLDTYGWIMYKKGDYEKAKLFVKRAIDLFGNKADAPLFDHLGNIYFKLNNKDKAIINWKIAKEKGSDDPVLDKKISEGKLYE